MRTLLTWFIRIGIAVYLLLFPGVLLFVGMEAAREASLGQAAVGLALTIAALLAPLIMLWAVLRLLTRKAGARVAAHEGQVQQ